MIQKLFLSFVKKVLAEHGADIAQQVITYLLALLDAKDTDTVAAVPAGLSDQLVVECTDIIAQAG